MIKKDIKKNTQFKVDDVFGDVNGNDNLGQEKIAKLIFFLAKIMWI